MAHLIKISLKEYGGPFSRMDFHVYTMWHNQKTDQVVIRTETGHYHFPVSAIDRMEILR